MHHALTACHQAARNVVFALALLLGFVLARWCGYVPSELVPGRDHQRH